MNKQIQKVISGLECCMSGQPEGLGCDRVPCPYCDFEDCEGMLHRDALVLLKAQEPREPHYTKLEYTVNGMPVAINHPECPRCYDNGLVLWDAEIEKGAAYCKRCGQAVKWE